jgi:erythromycin 3''-O-methyltransferase
VVDRPWRRWAHEARANARLRFVPTTRVSRTQALYEMLATDNYFTETSRYRNLGYWRDSPESADDACQAMADLVADAAALSPDDHVLDVACGFGEQDLVWIGDQAVSSLVSVDVTHSHIEWLSATASERSVGDRLAVVGASATELPFFAADFDRVVCIEAAFHFPSRAVFLGEAARVLRPGGRLAMTDIMLTPGRVGPLDRLLRRLFRAYVRVSPLTYPSENLYDRHELAGVLAASGFDDIQIRVISDDVFEPLLDYLLERVDQPEMKRDLHPLARWSWKLVAQRRFLRRWLERNAEYVLVSAERP